MLRSVFHALTLSILGYAVLTAQSGLFVITSDFATGSATWLAHGAGAQINLLNLHSDAVAHYHDGRIYVVNRMGQDNVLVLDATDPATPVVQFSVGNGTNPHDIEIVELDRAYVTRYETSGLLVVDPRNGNQRGIIDLSAFADSDGLPEVSQITRRGDFLYLTCQRLDRTKGWLPAGDSYVIVVDTVGDVVVDVDLTVDGIQAIDLFASNPNSIVALDNHLVVAVSANFGDLAGGIEVIDLESRRSLGLYVSEADLGGDITAVVMVDQRVGYAVVTDENFANMVRRFDLTNGQVSPPLGNLSGGYVATLAVDGQRLVVGDRGSFSDPGAAGLKFFDAATGAFIEGPVDTGLPPYSIAVVGDPSISTAVSGMVGEAIASQFNLGQAFPNPSNGGIVIPFFLSAVSSSSELIIYDLLGRRVRSLVSTPLHVGSNVARWDGRDDVGRIVGSGVYIVELHIGISRRAAAVTLLR